MQFSGIDGCKGGWFLIKLFDNNKWDAKVCENMEEIVNSTKDSMLTLIDIPIGLIDSGPDERRCDKEARRILKFPRSSSVFPTPTRPSLFGNSHKECSEINIKHSGRGLSIMSYSIIPKIRNVDEYFLKYFKIQNRIRETHPEVCFCAFSGSAMEFSKKKRKGREERLHVLENVFPSSREIYEKCLTEFKRKVVPKDDILDALAAAISAKFAYDNPISIPKEEQRDSKGIRMEIVYSK